MKKLRVMIADDQFLICDGIRIILESQPDIEVVAIASDGRTAVEYTQMHRPDLVLMDIQMPGMSGIEALQQIKSKFPQTVVLMLTTFDPDEYILGAFKNGADGYLLKDLSGEQLAAAIRNACAGNVTLPASVAARIIAQIPEEKHKKTLADYNLTTREKDVAELIAKGCQNETIAQTLGLSLGTTKNYISTLYSKLDAKNRHEVVYLIKELKNREQS